MKTTKPKAAAAARIGNALGRRKRAELLDLLRPCFARTEPWLQAGKVANGNGTVHLAYVREGTGHALIGARNGSRPGEWLLPY